MLSERNRSLILSELDEVDMTDLFHGYNNIF
jgi:hypothetical protein